MMGYCSLVRFSSMDAEMEEEENLDLMKIKKGALNVQRN